MNLNELKPSVVRKGRKRVGRGESSGWGKFSGRGNNGQRARSGGSINPTFEGGQTTYFRRIPKKGFSNFPFKDIFSLVNLQDIDIRYKEGEVVDRASLIKKGLLRRKSNKIKILGIGNIKSSLSFVVDRVSSSARDKIVAVKGIIEELGKK